MPIKSDTSISTPPRCRILRWLRLTKGSTVITGLAAVNTPISLPLSIIGAATCITEDSGSSGSLRVLRAPYCPCKVR